MGRVVYRETELLSANGDSRVIDVSDLDNLAFIGIQVTDDGNVSVQAQISFDDGAHWEDFGSAVTQGSFAAADDAAVSAVPLETSAGSLLRPTSIKFVVSGYSGSGVYRFRVSGARAADF